MKTKKIILLISLLLFLAITLTAFNSLGDKTNRNLLDQVNQAEQNTPQPEEPVQLPAPTEGAAVAQPSGGSGTLTSGIIIGLIIAGGVIIFILLGVSLGKRSAKKEEGNGQPEDK